MENFLDPRYLLGMLRRRWLLLVIPAILGTLGAVALAYLLPPVYQASARILVLSQQIPEDLARSTVAASAGERIRQIEERLKTRQNLLDLAERFNVFRGREDLETNDVVDRMRNAIAVSATADRNSSAGISTIQISFFASRPDVAAQVTNTLLTQILERNAAQRSSRASETLTFFSNEVSRLTGELSNVEAKIVAYRAQNQLAQPENVTFLRNEIAQLQRDALTRQSRRVGLEETIKTLEEAISLGLSSGTTPQSPEEAELARLQAQLAQQRSIYSDTHPSVRSTVARIEALKRAMSGEGQPSPDAEAGAEASAETGEDQQSAAETIRGNQAQRQLAQLKTELQLLDKQDENDKARMAELQDALNRSPTVGVELGKLQREQDSLRTQRETALRKQAEASTGMQLEVNQQAERLEVIEAPQVPSKPISPRRTLIAGGGMVVSIGLGIGLMALVELVFPVLRTPRDLESRLELRPIVTVPYIRTHRERRIAAWRWRTLAFLVLLLTPASLFLVDQYVMPLTVIADKLMERSGMNEFVNIVRLRLQR